MLCRRYCCFSVEMTCLVALLGKWLYGVFMKLCSKSLILRVTLLVRCAQPNSFHTTLVVLLFSYHLL